MSRRGRSKSAPVASSQRALAKALGKSQPAVCKWLRDDRWPFAKKGPWDVEKVRAWVERTLAPDPAASIDKPADAPEAKDLSPARQVDVELKMRRKERIEFDLEVDRGRYHRIDECQRHRLRQIHEVKTAFLNMADGLPIDPDSKLIVKGRVLEILRMFSAAPQSAPAAAGDDAAAAAGQSANSAPVV